jgi:hypothetical protein
MFTFEELSSSKSITTFAYWILVERRPLPERFATLDYLRSWMRFHFDVEEQVCIAERLLSTDKNLLPKFIRLIAPVTLAERWTPFSLATEILGEPARAERGVGFTSPALAIWNPIFLGACKPADRSEHARHFTFLLRLACSAAVEERGRVIIVGSPGWSYSSWKDKSFMMNPDTALLMHRAGYLYTDRICQ